MNMLAPSLLLDDDFGDRLSQGNAWASIKGLRTFTGLPLTDDHLSYVCSNSPLCLRHPTDISMARIIERFRNIILNGNKTPCQLSSESLHATVEHLDAFPKALGFHYEQVLRHECNLVVPRTIGDYASLGQVVLPLQIWRLNCHCLSCPMMDVALTLSLVHQFVRHISQFSEVDWTPVFEAIRYAPLENLPTAINYAGTMAMAYVRGEEDR